MSLSFVASAVQTGTADGGYEETPIESREVEAANRFNEHKPLFEQLRQNQEAEEAKREELQREMMRGTCALNEDDVAHLDALDKQRQEKERKLQLRTRDEIAMFRAARAERDITQLDEDEEDVTNDDTEMPKDAVNVVSTTTIPKAPKVVVKKRKLKGASNTKLESSKRTKAEETTGSEQTKQKDQGLSGLLGGYGSSSSDED